MSSLTMVPEASYSSCPSCHWVHTHTYAHESCAPSSVCLSDAGSSRAGGLVLGQNCAGHEDTLELPCIDLENLSSAPL